MKKAFARTLFLQFLPLWGFQKYTRNSLRNNPELTLNRWI